MRFEDITTEDVGVIIACVSYAFEEDSSNFEDRDFDVLDAILAKVCNNHNTTCQKWQDVISDLHCRFERLYHYEE